MYKDVHTAGAHPESVRQILKRGKKNQNVGGNVRNQSQRDIRSVPSAIQALANTKKQFDSGLPATFSCLHFLDHLLCDLKFPQGLSVETNDIFKNVHIGIKSQFCNF